MAEHQADAKREVRYLAFDLGAESSRAIVGGVTDDGISLEEIHRFPSRNVVASGTRYWDILYFLGEFKRAFAECARRYGPKLDGIGIDTWGVDFGFIGPSGQLLANPVHYRDHRTDGIVERAFDVLPREDIYRFTGIQFMPLNSLFQFWAALETTPEILRAAETFLLMPDLFNYFLTGVRRSEYTIASTTQMLDVHTRNWCAPLLDAFGLPMELMPELCEPASIIGPLDDAIAREAGLDVTNVIAPCCHDTGAAVAAIPAEGDSWAYISCGTWSLLGAELDEPVTSDKALQYNFTNEGGIGGTIRLLKNIMGLWVLQECRGAWEKRGQTYDYPELTELARDAAPFQTVIDVDDPSFLNPDDMLDAIAAHCRTTGQTPPDGTGATVRTVLEGIAIRYAVVLEQLEDIMGKCVDHIHMAGGGIQNRLLCQFAADATGRPVIAGPVEATAMGNVIAQALATGRLRDHAAGRSLIARSTGLETYEPQDTKRWRNIIDRVKNAS